MVAALSMRVRAVAEKLNRKVRRGYAEDAEEFCLCDVCVDLPVPHICPVLADVGKASTAECAEDTQRTRRNFDSCLMAIGNWRLAIGRMPAM